MHKRLESIPSADEAAPPDFRITPLFPQRERSTQQGEAIFGEIGVNSVAKGGRVIGKDTVLPDNRPRLTARLKAAPDAISSRFRQKNH